MQRCWRIVFRVLAGLIFIWAVMSFKAAHHFIALRRATDHIRRWTIMNSYDDVNDTGKLAHKIKILCWIMTSPKTLYEKAAHVKNTWAKRCYKSIFFSSETNRHFPTVGLNVSEGIEHLTAKTIQAFKYIYRYHFNEVDWFLKADDDTYVIFENLQYFLSKQNTTLPIMFGHHFTFGKLIYFHGGSGYVISKEALHKFGKFGNDSRLCKQDGKSEDIQFTKCMVNLGVKLGNSTDEHGRSRFHAFPPELYLTGKFPTWYYIHDTLGANYGMNSISDYPVSFHQVKPQQMYNLEFYAYHFRSYT